jgi:hypothetical protein
MACDNAAVLVTAFRRPAHLRQALDAIVAGDARRIYVSIDGPRAWIDADAEAVTAVRAVAEEFAKNHPVSILRSAKNGGTGLGVLRGIDWFFEHEEYGLIIEDDILIAPESLLLASELLSQYQKDLTVGSITLFNAVPSRRLLNPQDTVRRSLLVSSWYWGTWRDRWRSRVESSLNWRCIVDLDRLRMLGGNRFVEVIENVQDNYSEDENSVWESFWVLSHWANGWDVITTNRNYAVSLGFDEGATHLVQKPSWYPTRLETAKFSALQLQPALHDQKADLWMSDQRFGWSRSKRIKRKIKQKFPFSHLLWTWLRN